MQQSQRNGRTVLIWCGILLAIIVVSLLVSALRHDSDTTSSTTPPSTHADKPNDSTAPFNRNAYSVTEASSPWVIVNKQRPLYPKTYAPDLVVPDVALKGSASASNMHVSRTMAPALKQLFAAADTAGYNLMLSSGYRSYNYQVTVYNRIVAEKGQAAADRESARPGHSEHQTGLAADIAPKSGHCDLSQCFGATPEGQWVAANAYKYGFIIRYPQGKSAITGYEYEPWHLRYVGVELASQMHEQGNLTLEEFFNTGAAPNYN